MRRVSNLTQNKPTKRSYSLTVHCITETYQDREKDYIEMRCDLLFSPSTKYYFVICFLKFRDIY